MSRIVIVTYGSLGDLHPAIALARGLQARGHDVAIASSEPSRALLDAAGVPFIPVRPDLSPNDQALIQRIMDGWRGSEVLLREIVYPAVRAMYEDLAAIAPGVDLFIASELACAVAIVGERLRVPWAYFSLSPISFFPTHDPSHLPGPSIVRLIQSGGPAVNRFVVRLAKIASYSWWKPVRRLRRELGLSAGQSPLFHGKFSPHLNLAMFSSVLQPPQPDWPPHTVQTGFLLHDDSGSGAQARTLPAEVEAFLSGGEPIVFTLGSAAVNLAGDFYTQSAAAAELLGRRALLLTGNNPTPLQLPPSVLAWDYLPYAQVFPRAAAIVHQGGVGTTAQALRAGRPMLVMPFAHDQFDNADRVCRLGVARQIARHRYTAKRAAAELAPLLADAHYRETAGRLAGRVQVESGVAAACTAIERVLERAVPRNFT
jgi:UDP:flavonoid glycosyltransferase YjiC (YdhE family)